MSTLSSHPSRRSATFVQAVGEYLNLLIAIINGIVLVPFYLHYIGSENYGYWLASGGILGMLGLLNFGISSLMIQRISRSYAQKNYSQAADYFINGLIVYFLICIVYGLSAWLLSYWLTSVLKLNETNTDLITSCYRFAVIAMVISIFNEALRSFSQALLRPTVTTFGTVVGRVIGVCSTFYMIFNDYGLWAIPASLLITESFIFVVNCANTWKLFQKIKLKINLDVSILKEYLKNSPSMLMARIGETVSLQSEPLLITMFINAETTTIYMLSRRIAEIIFSLFSVCVGATMGPFAHVAGLNDQTRTIKLIKKLLFISISIALIGFASYIASANQFIFLWVGDDFVMGNLIITMLGLGFLSRSIRSVTSHILYGLGQFIYSSRVLLCEAIIRVGLIVFTLTELGVIGVPLSLFISCTVSTLLLIVQLQKRFPSAIFNTQTVSMIITVVISLIIGMGIQILDRHYDSWLNFILYVAGVFCVISLAIAVLNIKILFEVANRKLNNKKA